MKRILIVSMVLVGCGGGDSAPDAGDIDAPVTRGTIAFQWTIADQGGDPLACDDIGAGSVSITATPTAGGFGQVGPSSCDSGSGMSPQLEPNSYNLMFRLSGTAGTMDEVTHSMAVEVVAGQQADVGTIAFEVDPAGGFSFAIDTPASGGNCEAEGSGGGGLTNFEVELRDDEGTCIPTTFAVDDPNNASAPDYVANCAGATYDCVDSDVTFSVADALSGPHTLVFTGYKTGIECYSRTSQLVIPGAGLSLSLPTQQLTLMSTAECDPNAPDAGVGPDATPGP